MPRHANTHCDPFSHGKDPAGFPADLIAAYRPLHAAGLLDKTAAQRLNVRPHLVCRLRHALGLPSNLTSARRRAIHAPGTANRVAGMRAAAEATDARLEPIILDLNARGLADALIAARLRGTPDECSSQRVTRIRKRLCLPSHATTPSEAARRSLEAQRCRPVPLPPEPTDAHPGSVDKLQIMADRAAAGFQIFHPQDNRGDQ